jgi:prolyl oligopeptidase
MRRIPSRPLAAALVVLTAGTLFSVVPGRQRSEEAREGARLSYPPARRVGQVDTYHGVEVADPYRWMEEMESEEVRDWVRAQDRLLKSFVGEAPGRAELRRRVAELTRYDMYAAIRFVGPEFEKRGRRYFFIKTGAGASQPALYVQTGLTAEPRTLLDLRTRRGDDALRLAGFSPSPDGRLVAYLISQNLSNWLSLRVLDVVAGRELPETLEGLHFTGGTVTWAPDGRGFFYTGFERPAEGTEQRAAVRNAKVFFHALGTEQTADRLVHERPEGPGLLYNHQVTDDGRHLVVTATEGGGNKSRVSYADLRTPGGPLKTLIGEADADYKLLGGRGERLWFYTDSQAPRGRVVAIDVDRPQREHWVEVIPEAGETISAGSSVGGNALGLYGDRFVLVYIRDGRPLLRIFSRRGRLQREANFPEGGSIWGGFSGAPRDPEVFYRFLELASPGTIYRLNVATGKTSVFRRATVKVNPADFVVKRVFYRSKDGTRVPMFVAHKRGLRLDENTPVYLYGYGAFAWVAFTWFQPHMIAWMERGGLFAVAGLRGGGEYGAGWHEAGSRLNKQNAIDDYVAAAEWLVSNRYTSRRRLVANGGSASGVVAAAAILQRPDLFAAGVIDIPVLDMLRFDRFTAASYWKPEFGSPADPREFKALYAYSPYHNVRPGRCYPPTLVMAGERDQTAVPLHAYKFVAAMQAAQGCNHPVLLKLMWGTGHNFGATPERSVDSWTDLLSFLIRTIELKPQSETAASAREPQTFE